MDIAHLLTSINKNQDRFELYVDDHMAKIDYKIGKTGSMYLVHTEVPEEISNQGVAHKIVKDALEWAKQNNMTIIPLCPYVKKFVKGHFEEYKAILADVNQL